MCSLCYINAFVCYGSPMAPAVQSTKFSFHFKKKFFCRLLLVEDVGQVAATAVLTIRHGSHEDTSAALEGKPMLDSKCFCHDVQGVL